METLNGKQESEPRSGSMARAPESGQAEPSPAQAGGAAAARAAAPEAAEAPRARAAGREQQKAEKRHAILEGAVRVFAEKGFFNATVASIARAAGVADGTIYLYFKSKDDLLLQVFDEKMAELCQAAREAAATAGSAAEALRRVAVLHLDSVRKNPAVASVLIVELRQSSTFVRKSQKPRLAEYLDLMGEIVRRGQEAGEFHRDVHPAAFKRALFGALDEIALGWLLSRNKFDLERTAHEVAQMFVRGLLRTGTAAAPGAQQAPVLSPGAPATDDGGR